MNEKTKRKKHTHSHRDYQLPRFNALKKNNAAVAVAAVMGEQNKILVRKLENNF